MIGGADCTADCDAAGELSSLKGWVAGNAVGRGCSECTAGMASSAVLLTFTCLEAKSADGCLAIGAAIRVEDTLWFVTGGGAKTRGRACRWRIFDQRRQRANANDDRDGGNEAAAG
jgi:hypothetical protein